MTLGLPKAVLDAVICIYTVVIGVWLHTDKLPDPDHSALQGLRSRSPRGTGSHTQRAQGLASCTRVLLVAKPGLVLRLGLQERGGFAGPARHQLVVQLGSRRQPRCTQHLPGTQHRVCSHAVG